MKFVGYMDNSIECEFEMPLNILYWSRISFHSSLYRL